MTYSHLATRCQRQMAELALLQSRAYRYTPRGPEIDAIIWMKAEMLRQQLIRLEYRASALARANRRISRDQIKGPFARDLPMMALQSINPPSF